MAVVEQPTFQSRYPPAYYRDRLGWCLGELGEYPESERLLLSAHADFAATVGPAHAWTQLAISHLVRLYQSWKRPAQVAVWQAKVAAKK
jgi:hypothetical protein